ncbi:MAG: EAL domain-containing protein [Motiliproteus sp.]|nr:EAL domain-containing protein [Motiliproteus sp.]MCW9053010.1 EAL domain-containing protein [Motiliproteus sp.]
MVEDKQQSIAHKLKRMIFLTSACSMLLLSILFITAEVFNTRQALLQRTEILADVISTHVTASLSFGDTGTANKLLSSMESDDDILIAQIYQKDGSVFAEYLSESAQPSNESPVSNINSLIDTTRYEFTLQFLHLTSDITLDEESIGTLYVCASLATLWKTIALYLFALVLTLSGLLWLLNQLAYLLQRQISGPIRSILTSMKNISEEHDYSLRIKDVSDDEIGSIIHGFNEMIGTVEERDHEIHRKQREVEQHAFFDALTGLSNRRFLIQQLKHELDVITRNHSIGALIYLDLDHFKTINDSLGHDTGDLLLREVTERISQTLRATDLAARVGGDEFVLLLPEVGPDRTCAAKNALTIAESIRRKISLPYKIDGRTLHSSSSIGISLYHDTNNNAQELIKQADLAMYSAKKSGRDRVNFFSADMQQIAVHRLLVEQDLRHSIDQGGEQLELYYQPQCNKDGIISGAEALMRWHHPKHQDIGPGDYIPIAEMTGLIYPLGQWALRQACRQLAIWQAQNNWLTLAVNVSPNQFLHPGFIDDIRSTVLKTEVNPIFLELEITEGVIFTDKDEAIRIMTELKTLGIKISIDDFGTGYSSLQYLKALPISKLKIDQSFVRDIHDDPGDAVIVSTIIAMTEHLDLDVIAEGVENEAERDFLYQQGCQMYQGYLYGRPVSISEFEEMLNHRSKEAIASI